MAKKKLSPREHGTSIIEDILGKANLSEEKAAAVKLLLTDDTFVSVVEGIGEAGLRRSDHSREMDELKTYHTQLTEWFDANKAKLADLDTLATKNAELQAALSAMAAGDNGDGKGSLPAGFDPTKVVTKDDLDKMLNDRISQASREVVPLINLTVKLTQQHRREFGEDIDPDDILNHAARNKLNLVEAYNDLTKEKRDTKHAADKTAELKAAEERGAAAERQRLGGKGLPFPTRATGPSTLDGLDKAPDTSVDALVGAYHELVARTGAGA